MKIASHNASANDRSDILLQVFQPEEDIAESVLKRPEKTEIEVGSKSKEQRAMTGRKRFKYARILRLRPRLKNKE